MPRGPVVHPLHWRRIPGRTDEWREKLQAELKMDDRTWRREYEIDFGVEPGKPVFKPPFNPDWHVPKVEMIFNPGLPLLRGWDYGFHHPAVIIAQIATNGQMLYLYEETGEDIQLVDFVAGILAKCEGFMARRRYPSLDFDDPSGMNIKDEGLSSRQVLNSYHVWPINDNKKIPVEDSLKLVKANLALRKWDARPGSLVNRSCRTLIRAFDGAYCAKDDDSTKFLGGITKHIVDAVRYLNAGLFKMGRKPCDRRPWSFQT